MSRTVQTSQCTGNNLRRCLIGPWEIKAALILMSSIKKVSPSSLAAGRELCFILSKASTMHLKFTLYGPEMICDIYIIHNEWDQCRMRANISCILEYSQEWEPVPCLIHSVTLPFTRLGPQLVKFRWTPPPDKNVNIAFHNFQAQQLQYMLRRDRCYGKEMEVKVSQKPETIQW